jgi:hypothetical protein
MRGAAQGCDQTGLNRSRLLYHCIESEGEPPAGTVVEESRKQIREYNEIYDLPSERSSVERGPGRSRKGRAIMESATFRKWLADRGCRFDQHQQHRHEGSVMVTVHREGKKSEVPLGGSQQSLDPRIVRRACEELGLDWTKLPGPASRV